MKNLRRIEQVLKRMAELLRYGAVNDWARSFDGFIDTLVSAPTATAAKIIATYGGLGSLNDIVLYKNGNPLAVENIEFDALRSELYSLCHE